MKKTKKRTGEQKTQKRLTIAAFLKLLEEAYDDGWRRKKISGRIYFKQPLDRVRLIHCPIITAYIHKTKACGLCSGSESLKIATKMGMSHRDALLIMEASQKSLLGTERANEIRQQILRVGIK